MPYCCTFCFTCTNKQLPHQRGKVLFLSRPIRLRLMVVEQGTASKWWELLGSVGTHWLLFFAFCSLYGKDKTHIFRRGMQALWGLYAWGLFFKTRKKERKCDDVKIVKWINKKQMLNQASSEITWCKLGALCWWKLPCISHHCPRRSLHILMPSAE